MARIVLSNKTENAQLFAFFPFLPVVGNLESLESTESLLELQDREIWDNQTSPRVSNFALNIIMADYSLQLTSTNYRHPWDSQRRCRRPNWIWFFLVTYKNHKQQLKVFLL